APGLGMAYSPTHGCLGRVRYGLAERQVMSADAAGWRAACIASRASFSRRCAVASGFGRLAALRGIDVIPARRDARREMTLDFPRAAEVAARPGGHDDAHRGHLRTRPSPMQKPVMVWWGTGRTRARVTAVEIGQCRPPK